MKKYIRIIPIIFITITLFSCEKEVLEKEPYFTTTLENYIVDEETAEKALVGAYSGMASNGFYSIETTFSQISGSVIVGLAGNDEYVNQALKFRSTDYNVESIWEASFELVNNSNWVLKYVPELSESDFQNPERKIQILAEARFLRALGNSISLTSFGHWFNLDSEFGIPIRETLATKYSNLDIVRSSVKDSYINILEDLDYAIANMRVFSELPVNSDTRYTKKAWACVNTAKALKARVLINRGLNTDLDMIISLTNDVIADNTNYIMQNNSSGTVFKGASSGESILLNYGEYFSISPRDGYRPSDSGSALYIFGTVFKNLYNDAMFAGQNDLRMTTSVYTAGYYSTGWNGTLQRIIKYSGNEQQAYFIRLSEMHLLQAEVFARKGQLPQALTALGNIWNQAGSIAPVYTGVLDQDAVMKLILRENFIELSAEFGQEWQFLVRNDMVEDYRPLSRITGENFYVLPIPTKEIINNGLMVQNPGQETN